MVFGRVHRVHATPVVGRRGTDGNGTDHQQGADGHGADERWPVRRSRSTSTFKEEYWYSTFLKVVPFYPRAELLRASSGANMTIDNATAMRKEVRWTAWTVRDPLELSSMAVAAARALAALDAPPRDDDDDGWRTRGRQPTRLPRQRWQRQ